MSTDRALYKVHDRPVRIAIARREVSRVVVSPSHVTLELISLNDPLTSTVDLFTIDSIALGRVAATPHPALGAEAPNVAGLLRRRVTSCVATPAGDLDLRFAGSARLRSRRWNVGFGDGRHWAPHVDGRIAEWRPGEWRPRSRPLRRQAPRDHPLDTARSIPFAGQELRDLSFSDHGLGLRFAARLETRPHRWIERSPEIEVEIEGNFTLGPDRQVVQARASTSAVPLLALIGIPASRAIASPDGTLEIEFANGAVLYAGPGEGNLWSVTIADIGEWYLGKDGSITFSQPKPVRPLGETGRELLVRAYLEYSATDRPDLFWTTDRLRDLIEHAPDDAYEVIRELVRQAPSPYVLQIVAAGPLEDLLSDWGERFIDRLETHARDDPKLMAACAGVWKLFMPDEVWSRLRSLVASQVPG